MKKLRTIFAVIGFLFDSVMRVVTCVPPFPRHLPTVFLFSSCCFALVLVIELGLDTSTTTAQDPPL